MNKYLKHLAFFMAAILSMQINLGVSADGIYEEIAREKIKVSSSSVYKDNNPENAIDGDLKTFFHSQTGLPQDLNLDLGANYQVNRVRFYNRQDLMDLVYDYRIYTSLNGVQYKEVKRGILVYNGNEQAEVQIDIPATEARFVRLRSTRGKRTFLVIPEVAVDKVAGTEGIEKPLDLSGIRYYSDDLYNKLIGSIVLYINGNVAYINNEKKNIDEANTFVRPVIVDSRAMVPLRFLAEGLGANIGFDNATSQITISYGDKIIKTQIGSNIINVNGVDTALDVPTVEKHDRTLLPLRAVAECFGKKVSWDARGIIVIGDSEISFDTTGNELFDAKYGVLPTEVEYDKKAPQRQDVEDSRQNFDERNNYESIKSLSEKLMGYLKTDKPELAEIKLAFDNGEYYKTLDLFQKRFNEKIKGYSWAATLNTYVDSSSFPLGTTSASDLMANVIFTTKNEKLLIGTPSDINWTYDLKYKASIKNAQQYMVNYQNFTPLLTEYLKTHSPLLLDKWCDYIDSLCINSDGYDTRDALDVGYIIYAAASSIPARFVSQLRQINNTLVNDETGISSATLTRFLIRMMDDVELSILYARSNPQNWQGQVATGLVASGVIYDDFKAGDLYLDAGIKGHEAYYSQVCYPDGTEMQRDIWYNYEWATAMMEITDILKESRPDLLDVKWENWGNSYMLQRYSYLFRMQMYNGQYPVGLRNDGRNRSTLTLGTKSLSPILDNLPIESKIVNIGAGNVKAEEANIPFTSDFFPYGGYYIMRTGWDKNSQYGLFFGGRTEQDGFRIKASNLFGLHYKGQDLITAGEAGAYSMIPSPITVDGFEQNTEVGVLGFGHRRTYKPYDFDIPKFRSHTSSNYDLVEGVYNGAYAKYDRGTPEVFDDVNKSAFYDVQHQRIMQLLRNHNLWIMTDRMTSDKDRQYAQHIKIPVEPSDIKGYMAFKTNDIKMSAESRTIKAQSTDTNNLSIYQFANAPLSYKGENMVLPKEKMSGLYDVQVSFNGGNKQIISVIYPHDKANDDMSSIADINSVDKDINGFAANLKDGATVKYLSSAVKTKSLIIDNIEITGEALLKVNETDGSITGIVQGATSLKFNGNEKSINSTDFEYVIKNGEFIISEEIKTPLDQPEITASSSSFADKQNVVISAKQLDVDIRYTNDGTDPTLESTLYTAPFEIKDSCIIKAIAFRKGVKEMPLNKAATSASFIAYREFNKISLKDSVSISSDLVENGMNFKYYEGEWRKLMVDFTCGDNLAPVKSGKVDSLFDISSRATNSYFGYKYEGYLSIPENGTYTFYAPDEQKELQIIEGYELQLYIDGQKWNPDYRRPVWGEWEIALKKGMHTFEVRYVDYRMDKTDINIYSARYLLSFDKTVKTIGDLPRNFPDISIKTNLIWTGVTPTINMSGPNMFKQPIPNDMLFRKK